MENVADSRSEDKTTSIFRKENVFLLDEIREETIVSGKRFKTSYLNQTNMFSILTKRTNTKMMKKRNRQLTKRDKKPL